MKTGTAGTNNGSETIRRLPSSKPLAPDYGTFTLRYGPVGGKTVSVRVRLNLEHRRVFRMVEQALSNKRLRSREASGALTVTVESEEPLEVDSVVANLEPLDSAHGA